MFSSNSITSNPIKNQVHRDYPFHIFEKPLYQTITINVIFSPMCLPDTYELHKFTSSLKDYNFCESASVAYYPITNPLSLAYRTQIWDSYSLSMLCSNMNLPNPRDGDLAVNIFYVKGNCRPPMNSLAGLAFNKSSFAIFTDDVPRIHISSTLLHEFGHLLNFIEDKRRPPPVNPDRPKHCNNKKCVMFWVINDHCKFFDEDCVSDIRRKYGKKD